MRITPLRLLVTIVVVMLVTGIAAFGAYAAVKQLTVEAGDIAELPAFDPLGLRNNPTPVGLITGAVATPTRIAAAPTEAPPEVAETNPESIETGSVEVWSDPTRVTILLLGIDQRQGEDGPFRTDTLIIFSLDPVRRTAAMLSIPRDLWVSIPGFQPARVNVANSLGDSYEYPGGGPALAAATIERNLGLKIDHTIRVNFDLFLAAVDAVAPVEVCVDRTIHDDHYPDGSYGMMTVHFDPGCQPMNAEQLLQFARTRITEGGDFDRAARQQQVIKALRDRVLSLGGVQALLGKAAELWTSARNNIQTTLSLEELLSLAVLAQEIPSENITQAVLDANYVQFVTTNSGDQVLRLRGDAMRNLVQDLFNPLQLTRDDLERLASGESVTLSVVNGTTTQGLASDAKAWFEAQGFSVAEVGNATTSDYRTSLIKDYTNNPYSSRLLASLMGVPNTQVRPGSDNATVYDIQVVVGEDMIDVIRGGQ